jgi:hypothetical protein
MTSKSYLGMPSRNVSRRIAQIAPLSCYPIHIYYSYLIVNHSQAQIAPDYRRFKRSLLHLSFLVLGVLLYYPSLQANAHPAPDGPEVVIGPTRRDFGDVFSGEELEQNFPVRNVGNKPLELAQRSTLGTRITSSTLQISTADWRSINQPFVRTASARLAAPS